MLKGNESREFNGIKEGEYIGCSISIDDRSSTILNWFYVTESGVYMTLLEQVECKECNGRNYAWATVVIKPNGERIYRDVYN